MNAIVENRGRGPALDVRFRLESGGINGILSTQRAEVLEFGQKLAIAMTFDHNTAGSGSFLLEWSQDPNRHRRRSMRKPFSLPRSVSR